MSKKPSFFKTPLQNQTRTLAILLGQIQQQNLIMQHVRAALPTALSTHVSHCLIKDGKLLVYTNSAVWATQMRFSGERILAAVTPITTRPVDKLHIKVITVQTGPSVQFKRKANVPSPEKIAMLQQDSLAIRDEAVRASMLKLGATLARLAGKD